MMNVLLSMYAFCSIVAMSNAVKLSVMQECDFVHYCILWSNFMYIQSFLVMRGNRTC